MNNEARSPGVELKDPGPSLIGICHVWIRNVRLLKSPNEHVSAGSVGDLEVQELSRAGCVIHARFHPKLGGGFSCVINPQWEYLMEGPAIDVGAALATRRQGTLRSLRDLGGKNWVSFTSKFFAIYEEMVDAGFLKQVERNDVAIRYSLTDAGRAAIMESK